MVDKLRFIAEIGVNHNGDLEMAKDLIQASAESGATHAKLQFFQPGFLASDEALLAEYQIRNGVRSKSQSEMLEKLALKPDEVLELDTYADSLGLPLIVTPFDLNALDFVVANLRNKVVKIGSGDLTFVQLIFEASKSGAELIISTGMSTIDEVDRAVSVAMAGRAVHLGLLPPYFVPKTSELDFVDLDAKSSSWLAIMHCTSTYPAPIEQLNISALANLSKYNARLGYSDHSISNHGAIMALSFGALDFEKHITLSKTNEGPDHLSSLEPDEFSEYARDIRHAFLALGNGSKEVQASEFDVRNVARRSLFAAKDIRKGDAFTVSNLIALRPANFVPASEFYNRLGEVSSRTYRAGEAID
jgi:sialic acid synthase SpsE